MQKYDKKYQEELRNHENDGKLIFMDMQKYDKTYKIPRRETHKRLEILLSLL